MLLPVFVPKLRYRKCLRPLFDKKPLLLFVLQIKTTNFDDRKLEFFADAIDDDPPVLVTSLAGKISGFRQIFIVLPF